MEFEGTDLLGLDAKSIREIRGNRIAMIFQEPMSSLNPALTVGIQVAEPIHEHRRMPWSAALEKAAELISRVRIPDAQSRLASFPHQYSGGMRQRIMIAMSLGCTPSLIIADEPTTALDVTVQAQILDLLKQISKESGTSLVIITHDLGVVARYADRVIVMYAGRVVETAPARDLYKSPRHPYTLGLMASVPRLDGDTSQRLVPIEGAPPDLAQLPKGCAFAPRCRIATDRCRNERPPLEAVSPVHSKACFADVARQRPDAAPQNATEEILRVSDLKVHFPIKKGILVQREVATVKAVDGVSFALKRGETLGLVGESGCGKSTTGLAVLRMLVPTAGSILFEGVDVAGLDAKQMRGVRRRMQMVYQDPYGSLNPRMTVRDIIMEPFEVHGLAGDREGARARVDKLLALVGLLPGMAERYPHEFSGGQRQRIGIARALALEPSLIVCDEPVSALDVSIQAQVVNLFMDLQERLGLTYLFIAHDLAVVRHISDRIAVMYLGRIVEIARRDELYAKPLHPYTQALLAAVPVADPEVEATRPRAIVTGEVPSALRPPPGCRFHTRCPAAMPVCKERDPQLTDLGQGRALACHLHVDPV